MSHVVAQVALPVPLHHTFSYLVPVAMQTQAAAGMRVQVSLGKRLVIGIIVQIETKAHLDSPLKLLETVLDPRPVLDTALLQLALFARDYYLHPLGEILLHMLPVALRQGAASEPEPLLHWRLSALGRHIQESALKRAPRQWAIIQILREAPEGLSRELAQVWGIKLTELKTLERRELVDCVALAQDQRTTTAFPLLAEVPLSASAEQQQAINRINASNGFGCFLLEGVTGSGKTEVYLQVIAQVLERQQQALLLVPEINLTPQTVQRFQHRFRCQVVCLHSDLSDRERLNAWHLARNGQAGIIIGTRSALFTPLKNPGILIIDEEHDISFKQQDGFRYHARDLAIVRARLHGICIVLGSATPSLESLHNALAGRYHALELKLRNNNATLPHLYLQDIRQHTLEAGLSQDSLKHLRLHLKRGQQVLVFINRRGFAPVLLCHDCNWRAACPHCSVFPTLHQSAGVLLCHHCGWKQPVPVHCPKCKGAHLIPLGSGTERLQGYLSMHFPEYPLWRLDRDSVPNQKRLHHTLQEIHKNLPGIILGTQMLVKGHHFAAVSLVIIVDTDAGLFSADFRGAERCLQQVIQVAGRAGRAGIQGEVILQTHDPEHPLLEILLKEGYHALAMHLLTERDALQLPPYRHLALLHAQASHPEWIMEFLNSLHVMLPQISPFGPVTAPIEKKAGQYRAHLLLQSISRKQLHIDLQHLPQLCKEKSRHQIRWWLDVDPQDLL